MLEKSTAIKRFENSPLVSELKKQTDIAEEQYQGLDKAFSSNKHNKNENESLIKKEDLDKTLTKKLYKSNLIYSRTSFYVYGDDNKFGSLYFESKYSYLLIFHNDLKKFDSIKPSKLGKRKRKSV